MTDEVPDADIAILWIKQIGDIRNVEMEINRFHLNYMTDASRAHKFVNTRIPRSRMQQLFGSFVSNGNLENGNLSRGEILVMLRKLKGDCDASVLRMKKWMKGTASPHGTMMAPVREADSIECMVKTWSRDVIGGYERIAQEYMTQLDSLTLAPSNLSHFFLDAAKMSRSFAFHFPVLTAWNSNESVLYRASHGTTAWLGADVSREALSHPTVDTHISDVEMTDTTKLSAQDEGTDNSAVGEREAKRARNS